MCDCDISPRKLSTPSISTRSWCPRFLLAIRSIPALGCPELRTAQARPRGATTFRSGTESVSEPCKPGARETSSACRDGAVVKVTAECQEKITQLHLCSPE